MRPGARRLRPAPGHGRAPRATARPSSPSWRAGSPPPAERALALELELFEELRQAVLASSETVAGTAAALAELDLCAGLATLAAEQRYVRPLVDDSDAFLIQGGRHPVVEQALARGSQSFVANDCDLGPDASLWLLTGPNMAGKSTFLRQNALIAIMAQLGSFVPAAQGAYRRGRPAVLARGRRRRPRPRALDLHGRDGRDRGHPQSRRPAQPGDPGRDRPRHGHL